MEADRRYQLRHAAGRYWLLDMQQEGLTYRKPIELNECAAFIWEAYTSGQTQDQIASELQKHYGISMQQARKDAEQFVIRLREQGLV